MIKTVVGIELFISLDDKYGPVGIRKVNPSDKKPFKLLEYSWGIYVWLIMIGKEKRDREEEWWEIWWKRQVRNFISSSSS